MSFSSTPTPPRPQPRPPGERQRSALAGLTVVIYCHDDAATVGEAIADAARAADEVSRDYEIVVVDDGSSDATSQVAAGFCAPDGRVRLLLHPMVRGHGAALCTGIAAARMPWVALTDATAELDPAALEDFLSLTGNHDLLLGWRIMRRGPVGERANAATWNWLVGRLAGRHVRDVDCALKLARRDLLCTLGLQSRDELFGAELVMKTRAAGRRIAEIGVRQRPGLADRRLGGRSPRVDPIALVRLLSLRLRASGRRARQGVAGTQKLGTESR